MSRARDLSNILAGIPSSGVVGLTEAQTVTNKTIVDYSEQVYTLTGTIVDPALGSIQIIQLAGAITLTETLADSQTVTLLIENQDLYTITWPTIVWVSGSGNTSPTWTNKDVVVLWKVSSTLYGSYAGSYA